MIAHENIFFTNFFFTFFNLKLLGRAQKLQSIIQKTRPISEKGEVKREDRKNKKKNIERAFTNERKQTVSWLANGEKEV